MMQFPDGTATHWTAGKVRHPGLLAAAASATMLLLAACGGGGGGGDTAPAAPTQVPVTLGTPGPGDAQNHLPLAVGHSWQFAGTITEGSSTTPTSTTVTIPSTRDVAGTTALVLRESVVAGGQTEVIEEALGEELVARMEEVSSNPEEAARRGARAAAFLSRLTWAKTEPMRRDAGDTILRLNEVIS